MGGEGDAGGIHYGEEKLELAKIHARDSHSVPGGSFSFTKYNIQLSGFDNTAKEAYLPA
jgi:hypothetical protein